MPALRLTSMMIAALDATETLTFVDEKVALAALLGSREVDLVERHMRAVHELLRSHSPVRVIADRPINYCRVGELGGIQCPPFIIRMKGAAKAGRARRHPFVTIHKPAPAGAAVHLCFDERE